jgi:hypothetical protein
LHRSPPPHLKANYPNTNFNGNLNRNLNRKLNLNLNLNCKQLERSTGSPTVC